jgi:hypothetical protein
MKTLSGICGSRSDSKLGEDDGKRRFKGTSVGNVVNLRMGIITVVRKGPSTRAVFVHYVTGSLRRQVEAFPHAVNPRL